jgi:RNA-dependent RNA polymerase
MFSFLAYSNSALREHAVWFVAPFHDENGSLITADVIRSRLGNFDKVIRYPAKYGARMSQAFTSTSVSISIAAEEVIELPDIEKITNNRRVIFTDGIGTCSRGPRRNRDVVGTFRQCKSAWLVIKEC